MPTPARFARSGSQIGELPLTVKRLLALALLAVGCAEPVPPAPRADVLLVTLDTTRADRLGVYGYDRETSPHLDRLAADAVVFDRAIAQAAVTPVSHASILTGLDPYHHGLRVLHGRVGNVLAPEATTLAETWRQAGGQAAAFVSAYPAGSAFGLDRGFDPFDEAFGVGLAGPVSEDGTVNTLLSQRRADATTDAAIGWLRAGADRERPLFLWVHYFDPHDPHLLPPRQLAARFPPASGRRADKLRAIYDVEIHFMDEHLGRLLEAWREARDWEASLVAVTADHGEGLGDHDWWSHGLLYDEQIRVPLVVRWPDGPRGRRVAVQVRTIDLVPTVLEAAGLSGAEGLDGASLRPLLAAGGAAERPAYADSVNILSYGRLDDPDESDRKSDKLYGLIDAGLKLIYHQLHPEESELYELSSDPREERNLAAERPAEVRRLLAELERRGALSDILPGMTGYDLERRRRLRSLGYID